MMNIDKKTILATSLALVNFWIIDSATAANLIINGEFQTNSFNSSTKKYWTGDEHSVEWYVIKDDASAITGWTYTEGDAVEDSYIQAFNTPLAGGYFVTLGGGSPQSGGSLTQAFVVTAGQTYTASLDMAYFGAGQGVALTFGVYDVGTDAKLASYTATHGDSIFNLTNAFTTASFNFVSPISSNLYFKVFDATTSYASDTDVAFKNAVVSPVPEPSAFMLMGLGLLALVVIDRRRRA